MYGLHLHVTAGLGSSIFSLSVSIFKIFIISEIGMARSNLSGNLSRYWDTDVVLLGSLQVQFQFTGSLLLQDLHSDFLFHFESVFLWGVISFAGLLCNCVSRQFCVFLPHQFLCHESVRLSEFPVCFPVVFVLSYQVSEFWRVFLTD